MDGKNQVQDDKGWGGGLPWREGRGHMAIWRHSPCRKKENRLRHQQREPPLVWPQFSALTAAREGVCGVLKSCIHVGEGGAGAP